MRSAPIPRMQTALRRVSGIVPEIYRAFEFGSSKSTGYFRLENLSYDPHLEAMLVKAHARQQLQRSPNFSKVSFDKLAMCGISFRYKRWQFRLWKSADRGTPKIPKPGGSEARQLYFVQPTQQLELFKNKKINRPKLHLIILWSLDSQGNLEKLWLVCPESFDPSTGEISVYWVAELPNPLMATQAAIAPQQAEELPITPKKIKKAKEG